MSKVTHPDHYNQGIECWDYIVSHNMCFLQGNIIKYVTRYQDKGGLEDLRKAQQYLDKLIQTRYGKDETNNQGVPCVDEKTGHITYVPFP